MASKIILEDMFCMGNFYQMIRFGRMTPTYIESMHNGIMSLGVFTSSSLLCTTLLQNICECFEECALDYGVQVIKITLNEVPLFITEKSAKNPNALCELWQRKIYDPEV